MGLELTRMTITEVRPTELAPVTLATADGESRAATMWGLDSYTCGFCDSPVFGPADWEAHEQANADHYAKQGEPYTPEPYSYRAKYWEARECANPGCVVWFSGDRLADYRKRAADRKRYEDEQARWKAERERALAEQVAAAKAVEDKRQRGRDHSADTHEAALQLGFAWQCFKDECETSGTDRAEFTAHAKGHGLKAPRPVKPVRLRKTPPAASLRKLEVSPFKWLHWDETHVEPGECKCDHGQDSHGSRYFGDGDAQEPGCAECACTTDRYDIPRNVQEARRRGQFWSEGSRPHTVWILPFEPAPWETGRAAPVELHVSSLLKA